MTREERDLAITYLDEIKETYIEGEGYERHPLPEYYAIESAIKALNQEPKKDVLDKIKAEIVEEKECAYADFERYKVEYLGQDWEDAYDSLPQDEFRYGMERVIEIIDKYRQEG